MKQDQPDAELLRLGQEFEEVHAKWLPLESRRRELADCDGEIDDAANKAWNFVKDVTDKIRATPATTFAGLAVKARALRFDTDLSAQEEIHEDQEDAINEFISEVERLAEAESQLTLGAA